MLINTVTPSDTLITETYTIPYFQDTAVFWQQFVSIYKQWYRPSKIIIESTDIYKWSGSGGGNLCVKF